MLSEQPYPLLCIAALFWAGNAIVGRLAAGHIPPVTLGFLRWALAFLVTLPVAWKHLVRDWPAIRARFGSMVLISVVGISTFNTMQYWALEYTQALEPTTLLYITRDEFYMLLDSIPNWEKFYRQYLEGAYVTNTNRLMSFITQDAAERYRQLLQEDPEIVRRLPNRIVASYLNISPETLSRLKSKI